MAELTQSGSLGEVTPELITHLADSVVEKPPPRSARSAVEAVIWHLEEHGVVKLVGFLVEDDD